jgi:ADP-ribosylglycohydrolase
LPYEGLSRDRAQRYFKGELKQRLFFGKGLCSDDTEHACMTAQALLGSGGNPDRFAKILGWKLRWWLLGFPAGIGSATLRSCIKLWLGFPPRLSGVDSAGNGPAMRSAILGVILGNKPEVLGKFINAATVITHKDPRAEQGALIIALAAHLSSSSKGQMGPGEFRSFADEWNRLGLMTAQSLELMEQVISHLHMPPLEFMNSILGLETGVSGYINHTVSMAIHIWLTTPTDFRRAVSVAVDCGGDTDTLAAVVGGVVGAATGVTDIPADWLSNLWEYPRTQNWIKQLSNALAKYPSRETQQIAVNLPALILRNLFFLFAVLAHGFRRLAPPY